MQWHWVGVEWVCHACQGHEIGQVVCAFPLSIVAMCSVFAIFVVQIFQWLVQQRQWHWMSGINGRLNFFGRDSFGVKIEFRVLH